MKFLHAAAFLLAAVLASFPAMAQSTVLQGGPFTPGHLPLYTYNNFSSQPVLSDAGGAGGGAVGVNPSEMGISATGTGSPPFAAQGTGPNGENICDYDGPTTSAGGYHALCFSPNALGGGLISYNAFGGAASLPLLFQINGALNGLILGPGTTVVGHSVCWADTTGTLLSDCGAAPTGTVTSIATGTGLTGGPITTTGTISIANVLTAGGPIGSATTVPVITYNAQGQLTVVTSASISGVPPAGAAGGDLSGTYPNPTVAKVNGVAYGSGPSTNTVPVVTGSNTVTYEAVPLAAVAQSGANTMLGNWTGSTATVAANAMPSCADTTGNHLNYVSGTGITCGTSDSHAGTVTSIATTSPITGGTITTTGTIACATCVTSSGGGAITGTAPIAVSAAGVVSITSPLPLTNGGTNASLAASNGGLFYSTASAGAILAGTATAGQIPRSGATAAPTWSTSTYPATSAAGTVLSSLTANTITASAAPVLGAVGTTGTLGFSGTTGGTATITPQATAGTPTLTLPNASGTFAVSGTSPIVLSATTGALTCPTCATSSGGGAVTGTAPVAVSAAGVVSITGAAGQVLAGASPAFTATPTLGTAGSVLGTMTFAGNTSGSTVLQPTAAAAGTLTLPAATDTLVGKATTDTLTNKTFNTAGTGNAFQINGTGITAISGTGATVPLIATGSFTPAFSASGSTFSYASQTGSYVRIGNVIFCKFQIVMNGSGNTLTASALSMTGLPFTSDASGAASRTAITWFGTATGLASPTIVVGASTAAATFTYASSAPSSNNTVTMNASDLSTTSGTVISGDFFYFI